MTIVHTRLVKRRPTFLTLLTLLACGFVAGGSGCGPGDDTRSSSDTGHAHEQLWTCSMHPEVLEPEPDVCPICGMDLVPAGRTSSRSPSDDGVVNIEPSIVQHMGVRTELIERQPLFRHLRTIGEVETAEDLVSVVNLRFSGWIEEIHVSRTGEPIEAGEPLVEIYSPDLVAAQDEYLLARRAQGPDARLTKSARRKLDLFGLDARDIAAIETSGVARRTMPIRAPRSGHVLHKNAVEGARVSAGHDLYTIGDLSTVWVRAEVYEHDAPWVDVGQPARMELSHQRDQVIDGRVDYVYPTLDEMSRTLAVRIEFPNPDLRLKPGMFATVYVEFRRIDDAIAVPSEAILHSGTRELVFVALGQGRFEPRVITTGLVGDRRLTEVRSGLEPGEEVVTSGQFLIDSESQLQAAISRLRDEAQATSPTTPGVGATPEIFACPMHPEQIAEEPGHCAVCGMTLERRAASPAELERLKARETAAPIDAEGDR